MSSGISERLAAIRARMREAALRAGRDPGAARLMGVTKTVEPERVREAFLAGLTLFGENYVQEALPKVAALAPEAEFHFIGHLQSNKAKKAVETFSAVQSLDRPSLADALNRAALAAGRTLPVLIEVNLGDEETKAGCDAEGALALARLAGGWPGLSVAGLMALPPWSENPEESRPHFRELARLAKSIDALKLPNVSMRELSMGMSNDFEVAIEEGATIVRVGTLLFGSRNT